MGENTKRVLLIGGTGTLSGAVLKKALKEKYDVTIMNRGTHNHNVPSIVTVLKGDFYSSDNMRSLFKDDYYDVVVDFLSRTPSDIERVYPIFKDICKQYIFISSACIYRRAKEDFPIKEDSPKPNMNWSYNIEKFECEKLLRQLSLGANSVYTIIRPYITYNGQRIPLGIAPAYKYHKTIIERIKSGKPWFVWDEGRTLTTLTYTDDFAVGVVGLFLNEKAKNNDFHITSDYQYTQKEVVGMIFDKLGMPINVVSIPSSDMAKILPEYSQILIGDRALDAVFDNSKIKDAVPQLEFNTPLNKGLDKILKYWGEEESCYDYEFEGRIDFLLSKYGVKTKYKRYDGADRNSLLIYLLYKYCPIKVANKIKRWI